MGPEPKFPGESLFTGSGTVIAELKRRVAKLEETVRRLEGSKSRLYVDQFHSAPCTGSELVANGDDYPINPLEIYTCPLHLMAPIDVEKVEFNQMRVAGNPGVFVSTALAVYRMLNRDAGVNADEDNYPHLILVRVLGAPPAEDDDHESMELHLGRTLRLDPSAAQYHLAWMVNTDESRPQGASRHVESPLVGCYTGHVASTFNEWPQNLSVLHQSGEVGVPIVSFMSRRGARIFGEIY